MNRNIIITFVIIAVAAANALDWRIVGGDKAEDGQFPYQISLRVRGQHSCGGSILNKRWVLTAAHCVEGFTKNPSSLTVVAGTNKLNENGETYEVVVAIYHENWNRGKLVNDVGLVRVKTDIKFNTKVQPIELNTEDIGGDANLILSGWGTTTYPGSLPNDLQYIRLKSLTVKDCQSRQSIEVFETQICTFTKRGEGACHGDSGGPLVYNGKVCGIVSWGRPCAVGYPDVFTRVSSFSSWIEEHTRISN